MKELWKEIKWHFTGYGYGERIMNWIYVIVIIAIIIAGCLVKE